VSACSSRFIPPCAPGSGAGSGRTDRAAGRGVGRDRGRPAHADRAPTGSGKTLSAFLVCIDRFYWTHDLACEHDLYCGHDAGARPDGARPDGASEWPAAGLPTGSGPQIVYVSPLKALATDIQQNLEAPLHELAAMAGQLGPRPPASRVTVGTGDTAAVERAAGPGERDRQGPPWGPTGRDDLGRGQLRAR